jgi:hypothetical protein
LKALNSRDRYPGSKSSPRILPSAALGGLVVGWCGSAGFAGMSGGVVSPRVEWFRVATPDLVGLRWCGFTDHVVGQRFGVVGWA